MEWKDIKDKIYYHDGSLRDIYILNFSLEDWEKWSDYVNTHYKIKFINNENETEEEKIDFEIVITGWQDTSEFRPTAKIFINNLQINTFFFWELEFDNDIDPKEFNTLDDHNHLLDYLSKISNLLGKDLIVTPELHSEFILMKISGNEVIYY